MKNSNSDFQSYIGDRGDLNKSPNNIKSLKNQDNIMLSNNNLNNTKFLMDDTMGVSNNSLFISNNSNLKNAIIQSKLNNTQNLLNDKNSLFSQAKLISSNASDINKFKEKYKDLLPEISLQNSVDTQVINNHYNTIEKIQETNKNNTYANNPKFNANQAIEDNYPYENEKEKRKKNFHSLKSQNEMYIIDNIKEENENVETINLTSNNQLDNQLNTNFNVSKEEDSEDGDGDKRNTNFYCLTNSNIENKFYSSILETNDFFKNQRAEKDENFANNINKNIDNKEDGKLKEEVFSFQKLEDNFELERIKNQRYLIELGNQNLNQEDFHKQFNNFNQDKYTNNEVNNLHPRNNSNRKSEYTNAKIISFRDNDQANNYNNRIQEPSNPNENYDGDDAIYPTNHANQSIITL